MPIYFGEGFKRVILVGNYASNAYLLLHSLQRVKQFKPVSSHKYGDLSREWLEWVSSSENIKISHLFNGKEKRIGPRNLAVDGYCAENKTVYQLHGCYWHGHKCHLN